MITPPRNPGCTNGHLWIWHESEMPNWLRCQCGKMTYGEMRRKEARQVLASEPLMSPVVAYVLLAIALASLLVAAGVG